VDIQMPEEYLEDIVGLDQLIEDAKAVLSREREIWEKATKQYDRAVMGSVGKSVEWEEMLEGGKALVNGKVRIVEGAKKLFWFMVRQRMPDLPEKVRYDRERKIFVTEE